MSLQYNIMTFIKYVSSIKKITFTMPRKVSSSSSVMVNSYSSFLKTGALSLMSIAVILRNSLVICNKKRAYMRKGIVVQYFFFFKVIHVLLEIKWLIFNLNCFRKEFI